MLTQNEPDWATITRNYGRIRLSEPMAGELFAILKHEHHRRLAAYEAAVLNKERSDLLFERKRAMRLTEKMYKQVWELIREKGWDGAGEE